MNEYDQENTARTSLPGAVARWRDDVALTAAFLTRAPVRLVPEEDRPLATACRAFPVIGAGVGFIAGAGFALAGWLGLPPLACALIAVGAGALVTGALHEDGLADAADGFGGGGDTQEQLEIMRDSRIGTYGVVALVLVIGLKVAALAALAEIGGGAGWAALITAGALSRSSLAVMMLRLDTVRSDGLGHGAGRPQGRDMLIGIIIAAVIAVLFSGLVAGVVAFVVAMVAMAAVAGIAIVRIGGYTGDVLGAAQQAAEVAALLAIAAVMV